MHSDTDKYFDYFKILRFKPPFLGDLGIKICDVFWVFLYIEMVKKKVCLSLPFWKHDTKCNGYSIANYAISLFSLKSNKIIMICTCTMHKKNKKVFFIFLHLAYTYILRYQLMFPRLTQQELWWPSIWISRRNLTRICQRHLVVIIVKHSNSQFKVPDNRAESLGHVNTPGVYIPMNYSEPSQVQHSGYNLI